MTKKSNKDNSLLLFLISRLLSGSPNIFPQGLSLQSEASPPTNGIVSASPTASLYSPASPKVLGCLFPIMQCSFIQVKEHWSHYPSFHNKFLGPNLFSEIVTIFLICLPENGNCLFTELEIFMIKERHQVPWKILPNPSACSLGERMTKKSNKDHSPYSLF